MKLTILFLLLFSFPMFAQILNGGFEQWSSGEPVSWQTNNINEPNLTLTPITQSSFTHGGLSALKGEVLQIPTEGPNITHAPILVSGTLEDPVFSYSGRPKQIRGYYNFQSVGGDGFTANFLLLSGENPVAVSGFTNYNSTGPGYHELIMTFIYVDTVSVPDAIEMFFQISSAPGQTFANAGSIFYIDDFPKMTLIKPEEAPQEFEGEQPVFISGEVDTIKWDTGGAMNIDIKYSTDNGSTFQSIINNYPGDSSRYFWAVPGSLLTREAQIKIVESQNTTNEVESIDFTIKPWQLTRLDASNNLELFEPNEDGWNFNNSKPNVWPQTWWQQFDYSGIDPITGEDYPRWFPFINADPSDFPDWPLFVDVFGEVNCYSWGNVYRSEATTHWGGIFAGVRSDWGGSCFGFAVSGLLGFYHTASLVQKFPSIGNFTNLFNVILNNDSRYVVNYFFVHQFSTESQATKSARLNSYTPRELLQDLKEMFRKENGDSRTLAFYNPNGPGGHAVTPYKLKRVVGPTSNFNVHVYDSRAPGGEDQRILIDSIDNQWYDATGLNWGTGNSGCFLRRESVNFLSPPTLPDASDRTFPSFKSQNGLTNLTIYNTSYADIIITSSNGDQICFQDSNSFGNIHNGNPLIPETSSYQPPIGYDIPEDTYSLQINNFTDSSSYAFFLSDSTIYNYRRFDANNNEFDVLSYSQSGIGIINPDPVDKNTILETIILEDSTSEKVFVTRNVNLSAGDSIHIREKDRNELLMQNYGESMNYDLQVRYASVNGQSIFFHMSIPMDQNSAHQIVPVWENLANEPISILIDLANDGTIDDTLTLENQVTGVEGDQGLILTPNNYNLAQNYPNPFNPTTSIRYSIPQRSNVTIKVYDILGNEVANLVNEAKEQGVYTVTFNAAGLSSGIYFYKLQSGSFVETKKMLLLK